MATDRRTLLKGFAATAAATMTVVSTPATARERKNARADAVGLLYDATKCVGCKACVVKCKEINKLESDRRADAKYDAPEGLNEYTKNVIQLARYGDETSFVKKQCMHCIDPACAGACMLGALHKAEFGIVSWDGSKCVGCRYCQVACPFNVPKFEWTSVAPKIVKCELCKDRLAEGKQPGCAEVCPRKAVIFGKYQELLDEAHTRLAKDPTKYVQKVYGEKDLGGTQVLYLSHIPFENLGFRFSGEQPVPEVQQTVQHGIYKGFVGPVALYALLGAVMFRNRKKGADE